MKPEKLYRCPACGEVITDEEYEAQFESGGSSYCLCDFSETDPDTGEVWFPRIFHEYDVYHHSASSVRDEE